jgi:hypothetical protein
LFVSHERAWLKTDMFLVQVQAVIEIENRECAKILEEAVKQRYGVDKVIMGAYGLNFN